MHVYRLERKRQERKIKIVITLCFMGILLFFIEYGRQSTVFQNEVIRLAYQEMVSYCLPVFGYLEEPMTEVSMQEKILYYFFPVLEQGKEAIKYQTDVESEFSYEMILAMEAAAENYVDEETGEVIGNTSSAELMPEIPAAAETAENIEMTENGTEILADAQTEVIAVQTAGKMQKAVSYSSEKLADFDYLIQNFYRVDKTTTITGEQLNAQEMLAKDMRLTHNADSPQILIYHTHSQEGYVDSIAGDSSTTVVGVGEYLAQLLREQYGLNVIHHMGEYDVGDRDHAYSKAGPALEQILAENPSIEVVIDLHRDGVGENTRLVTNMDGMDMAKIMFVNGLSRTTSAGNIGYLYNPNLADNLAFSFQTQLITAEYYPGLSRGVYLKGYRFNLHYCPKTLLVEVGAQTNTLQEAKNAMIPLADILHKVITEKNTD